MDKQTYINKVAPYAIQASKESGIPASLIIAQSALESGWGGSSLASQYNNYFGIKGSGVNMPTTEYGSNGSYSTVAGFRTYSDMQGSFTDWVKFLKDNSRYTKAGVFSTTDPAGVAQALQRGGYATDPNYASKLTSTISANGLNKFDDPSIQASQPNLPSGVATTSAGGSSGGLFSMISTNVLRWVILLVLFLIGVVALMRALPSNVPVVNEVGTAVKGATQITKAVVTKKIPVGGK